MITTLKNFLLYSLVQRNVVDTWLVESINVQNYAVPQMPPDRITYVFEFVIFHFFAQSTIVMNSVTKECADLAKW